MTERADIQRKDKISTVVELVVAYCDGYELDKKESQHLKELRGRFGSLVHSMTAEEKALAREALGQAGFSHLRI